MKRGKKSKKRKRGVASRIRIKNQTTQLRGEVIFPQHSEKKLQRMKELDDENRHIFEKIIRRYDLSYDFLLWLEYEYKLGLSVIDDYEDATPDELEDLWLVTYDFQPLSEIVDDTGEPEVYWRATFDLTNELGLSMINIDDDGNITGERIEY